jgi:thiol-disulfide isomerase/thioredoxin
MKQSQTLIMLSKAATDFIKYFFLALTICLLCNFSFAQKSITIPLTTHGGYGPFRSGSLWTGPLDADKPKVSNIPADIKEYVIRSIDFQEYNKVYRTYVEQYGLTKQQILPGLTTYDYDTTMLTAKDYLHRFNVIVGTNLKNQLVVIIDVNNNSSYSDDMVYTFEKLTTAEEQSKVKLPTTILPFEFYDGKSIRKLPTKVFINPYRGNWNVNFIDTVENKYFLAIKILLYKKGTITVRGKKYNIFLYNYGQALSYTGANTRLMIWPAGKTLLTESEGNETFKIGDTFTTDHQQYKFASTSMFGDTVKLDYIGYTSRPTGAFENYYVPNVAANTVDGVPFNLSNHKGRYVLLDFWGTWCAPCIQAMPGIALLHEKYKDKSFVMVSVADDHDLSKVKQFNEHLKMNWINVFQQRGGTGSERNLIDKFKISEFPTLILVDPDGKIISRGKTIGEVERILAKALSSSTNAADTGLPK